MGRTQIADEAHRRRFVTQIGGMPAQRRRRRTCPAAADGVDFIEAGQQQLTQARGADKTRYTCGEQTLHRATF